MQVEGKVESFDLWSPDRVFRRQAAPRGDAAWSCRAVPSLLNPVLSAAGSLNGKITCEALSRNYVLSHGKVEIEVRT